MIIKFDHIALSCKRQELDKTLNLFSEYKQEFFEKNLPNLSIKKEFMSTWTINHDIVLLNKENCLPVEITAYDNTVNEVKKFEINNDIISVFTDNLQDTESFYQAIGFKKRNNLMELKTILDKRPLLLTVVLKKSKEPWNVCLDTSGYCCLAFVTNNAEKERGKLSKSKVKTTDIQQLRINGKDINVFFAYNNHGDICEFISII